MCDARMLDTCHYNLTHRMYNMKSDPNVMILVDNDVSM